METEAIAPATVAYQVPVQEHVCSRHCSVQLLFGNCYKCESSGKIHICDQNCDQLMEWDRDNRICKVSRKVVPRSTVTHSTSLERCDTTTRNFTSGGLCRSLR